jgi:hypothetical protein
MFMHASIFVMLGFLFWHNIPVIELNRGSRMLATQWSTRYGDLPLSIGCVLIGLYQVRLVLRSPRSTALREGSRNDAAAMLVVLLVFTLLGMEIAWAIASPASPTSRCRSSPTRRLRLRSSRSR